MDLMVLKVQNWLKMRHMVNMRLLVDLIGF